MTGTFQDGTDDRTRDWIIVYDEYIGHLPATALGIANRLLTLFFARRFNRSLKSVLQRTTIPDICRSAGLARSSANNHRAKNGRVKGSPIPAQIDNVP